MTFGKHPQQLKVLPEGEPARGDDIVVGEVGVPFEFPETGTATPESEGDVCGLPVGNGTCILPAGHAGNHRLTPPEVTA